MSLFRLQYIPIHLAIMTVLLNNWRLGEGGFNFSDPLLVLGLLILIQVQPKFTPRQVLLFLVVFVIVGVNILVASLFTSGYSSVSGAIYLLKVPTYTLYIILLHNYIVSRALVGVSLKILVGWTVVTCIIGLYITLVLQSGVGLPYKFFWEFTRQDRASYTFRGASGVIRTRSIFSEPQYFGFFLNTVLLFAFFNNQGYKVKTFYVVTIAGTAITTYSFSTVPMTVVLVVAFVIKRYALKGFVSVLIAMILAFSTTGTALLSEGLRVTIFERFEEIRDGDDNSANLRLYGSWEYFEPSSILQGLGIGASPPIWNNYAYVITELGIFAFLLILYITYVLFKRNFYFGMYFIFFTYTKGGYLSAFYWTLLAFFFIFSASMIYEQPSGHKKAKRQQAKEVVSL